MPLSYVEKLQKRISVGRGEIPGDWVLKIVDLSMYIHKPFVVAILSARTGILPV